MKKIITLIIILSIFFGIKLDALNDKIEYNSTSIDNNSLMVDNTRDRMDSYARNLFYVSEIVYEKETEKAIKILKDAGYNVDGLVYDGYFNNILTVYCNNTKDVGCEYNEYWTMAVNLRTKSILIN